MIGYSVTHEIHEIKSALKRLAVAGLLHPLSPGRVIRVVGGCRLNLGPENLDVCQRAAAGVRIG